MHVTTWRISARHFLLGARTYELLMILWKYNLSTCFILIIHSHKPEVADAVILNSLLQKACLQRKRLLDQQTHDQWQEQSPLKILKIRKIKTRNRYNVWGFFFYPCGFSFFITKRFLLKHDNFGCSLFSYLSIYHLSRAMGLLYFITWINIITKSGASISKERKPHDFPTSLNLYERWNGVQRTRASTDVMVVVGKEWRIGCFKLKRKYSSLFLEGTLFQSSNTNPTWILEQMQIQLSNQA